ncbi:MAG: hypothetical protein PUG48_12235 [Clostridia bacterium]|nr:hypothetical protein [Clostridia bacterium]
MGISFGRRKLKIKVFNEPENKKAETAEKTDKLQVVPEIQVTEKEDVQKIKVTKDLKTILKEISSISVNTLNLSDFSVYSYYTSDNRIKFSKVFGSLNLSDITLEKYLSFADITVIRRATGLSVSERFRSSLIMLRSINGKSYIFIWSSILYEIFSDEKISQIKLLLDEMRNEL